MARQATCGRSDYHGVPSTKMVPTGVRARNNPIPLESCIWFWCVKAQHIYKRTMENTTYHTHNYVTMKIFVLVVSDGMFLAVVTVRL